jgi:pimeloyl-[acyl-carrier protein] synthase
MGDTEKSATIHTARRQHYSTGIEMSKIDITLTDPFVSKVSDLVRNPYPFYEQIRKEGNIVWSSAVEKRWVAVGYNVNVMCLTDNRFSVEPSPEYMEQVGQMQHSSHHADLITGLTKFMLAQDPPQHTRVRKLVNKAFTRAEVSDMSALIQKIIDQLIDGVISSGKMDLIADFAFPLPLTIICGVLGFPQSDHEILKHWTEAIIPTIEPVASEEILHDGGTAATEMFNYFREQIQYRRQKPQQDLLSALVQAEEGGDTLSLDELLANLLLLVIAGHETTVNLIGNGMLSLIEHPQQMDKLRKNPDLIPSAIEEFLRYQSPLQMTDRYVKDNMEIEGQQLKKGDRVSLILGAANRDPQQFEDPNTFNIERQPNKHLAFGQGIHFCVGAPLARFEGKLAFEQLLSKLANIILDADNVQYKPVVGFRGLSSLPIKFDVPALAT